MNSPSPGLTCKQQKFKISGFKYLRSEDKGGIVLFSCTYTVPLLLAFLKFKTCVILVVICLLKYCI